MSVLQQPEVGTGVRESLRFLDLPAGWVLVLVCLPAAALLAWLAYAREPIRQRMRVLLGVLRAAVVLLLLAVLFRPVWVERREEVRPAEVLVLVDDSASMQRRDGWAGDREAAGKLAETTGLDPARATRSELARAGIERVLLPRLKERDYQLRLSRFSEALEPLSSLEGLEARGRGTHLGDALSQALAANRGRHVTDVVLVSDGRATGGSSALEAARAARAAGVPVHAVIVGDVRPERNLRLELVEAPPSALEGDEIAITVRVSARGTAAGQRGRVVLYEVEGERDAQSLRPLAEEELALDESGERVVLLAPPAPVLERRAAERRFLVRAPPLPEETLLDDNELALGVRITPEKIRVLYVDGYPRWEYRYLKNLLLRADQNLEAQCFLLSATPDFPQESTRGLPPLTEVPTERRELLENYDVVILGDVNPYAISLDPSRCEQFLGSLREFVERGGGLIFLAGEYDNPRALVRTPLEEVLPVVLDHTGALRFDGDTTREQHPVLEEPANPHEIVRLHPDPETNRRLWEEEGGLRGFYWYHPVERAKPGSQVLLRHPQDGGPQGRYPLLTVGYFPAGRTLFLAIDSTWMWRYRYGDRYHERFWRNAIRWVALGRLKSGDRRSQIDSLHQQWDLEDRITLEARVLDEDYRPSERAQQEAVLVGPDQEPQELTLEAVEGRTGLYRSTFEVEQPGTWQAWLVVDGERTAGTEFDVVLPMRETAEPAPDPQTMRSIASLSGGRAVLLGSLDELFEELPGDEERREPISSELEDAWDQWGTLLLAVALLSVEWVLRKRLELV